MRCAAEPPRPGRRLLPGAGLVLAGCLIAGCSGPARPATGPGSPGRPGAGPASGPAGQRVTVYGTGGVVQEGGGGSVFVIAGPGGGAVAVPPAGGSGGRPRITVGPIPLAGSGRVVSLPLGTYATVALGQQSVLSEASTLLTQKCMASRGFVYTEQASPSQDQSLVQQAEYPFGVTSPDSAASYGYGQPKAPAGPKAGPAFLGGFASFGDLAKKPRAWVAALLGFAPGERISPNPAAGCLSEASRQLFGSRGGLDDPVPTIAFQAANWTQSDPRIEAVDAAWSRCMAAHGYKYASPLQAAGKHWPATPTPTETATARADVTCKQAVNLGNTWLAVEAAYQTALIGHDLATLASLQGSFTAVLHRAETLLGLPFVPAVSPPRRPGR